MVVGIHVAYLGVSGGDGNQEFLRQGTSTFICLPARQNGVSSSEGMYVGRQ
jgi:hypothetical protein